MRILAIETSCDETGIALVEGRTQGDALLFLVIKEALLSQAALHAEYGGVYPTLAKREHEKNLPILFQQFADEKVDAIAVTHGPGLEPALWTGVEFAKQLAAEWGVPLIPTNHMEGHLLSSLATKKAGAAQWELVDVALPVLALLISGGHTEFVLMRDWFQYEIIGRTLDDAVGEAFDKVARMLELPYPGGPHISKHAELAREAQKIAYPENQISAPRFPRPMLHSNSCDFSFSGLKTAALYALRDRGGATTLSSEERADFAREFEDAVTDVLVAKTKRALEQTGAHTFVIGGGVAANTHIRRSLEHLITHNFSDVTFRTPELAITGDNAIMIAIAALARALSGAASTAPPESIRAQGNLSLSSAI